MARPDCGIGKIGNLGLAHTGRLMGTSSTKIELVIEDEHLAGTFLAPESKVPGVLFVHGWGGSQERDLDRARGIAGLGCVCLTFDLRGHEKG